MEKPIITTFIIPDVDGSYLVTSELMYRTSKRVTKDEITSYGVESLKSAEKVTQQFLKDKIGGDQ